MPRHIPVMLPAVIEALRPGHPGVRRLIDGTVGAGGHTSALLKAGIDQALALDRDAQALDVAEQALADFGERVALRQASYVDMRAAAGELGWDAVDAILLDLGLSSLQLDAPERGFSFRYDAPLDMRFEAESDGPRAHDLVNGLPVDELASLLFRYGEERHARRIARAIIARRPVRSTQALAELVASAMPAAARRASKVHPATRTFQALRIAVNGELEAVEAVIPRAIDLLRPGGRLAIISFHSLEDRLVKQAFRQRATAVLSPPGMASIQARPAQIKLVNRKPLMPDAAEVAVNPRSRSAKLRVIEKL